MDNNDDELEQGPIVEDESNLSLSEAIIDAIKSYANSTNNSSPSENTSEDGSTQSNNDEQNDQYNNPSGQPVDGVQQKDSKSSSDNNDSDNDDNDNDDDDDDDDSIKSKDTDDDDESKNKLKEKLERAKERKQQADQFRKKLKDDSQKKLKSKITSTFHNPASKIPGDIKDSLKETGKSIKDASKRVMENSILKPKEKKATIKEVATENTKVGAKQTAIETGLKAVREVLKKLYTTPPVAFYAWAVTIVIIAVLFIFLILLAILIACSTSAAGAAASTEAENMTENFSITSEYFYGIRTAYIDEDALANSLQQSYKQYAIDILEDIDSVNGVSISITLPKITDDKPFTNKTQVDIHITNISVAIGNIVATGSDEYYEIEFSTLYPQIPYFGLNESEVNDVNEFITQYLTNNNLIDIGDSDTTIDNLVDSSIKKLTYINNICEKVMIKDIIADESGLKDVEQLVYVGSIYMPNKDIIITELSTAITTTTPENPVKVEYIAKNGEKVLLTTSGTTASDDGKLILDSVDNSNLELSAFTSIDTNNTKAFSNGISLFEALRLGEKDEKDYSIFFQKQTIKEGVEFYTWKPSSESMMYLTYESSSKFIFSDLLFKATSQDTAA